MLALRLIDCVVLWVEVLLWGINAKTVTMVVMHEYRKDAIKFQIIKAFLLSQLPGENYFMEFI